MKKILNLTGSSIDGSVTVKPTINPVLFIMLAINGLLIGSLGPIGTRLPRSQLKYEFKRYPFGLNFKGSYYKRGFRVDYVVLQWYLTVCCKS